MKAFFKSLWCIWTWKHNQAGFGIRIKNKQYFQCAYCKGLTRQ